MNVIDNQRLCYIIYRILLSNSKPYNPLINSGALAVCGLLLPEVSFQEDSAPNETVRHLYCLRFDLEALCTTRRFIFDALRAENVGVNVYYQPVYWLPYYQGLGYERGLCPEAEAYYQSVVTLPWHCGMDDKDVEAVIEAVRKVVEYCREAI